MQRSKAVKEIVKMRGIEVKMEEGQKKEEGGGRDMTEPVGKGRWRQKD